MIPLHQQRDVQASHPTREAIEPMTDAIQNEETDGRALRSERSRQKIVDALFALVGEGTVLPTAKLVAERAKLGIRTVFRHFADMDSLFEELANRLKADIQEWLRYDIPDGTVAERLDELLRLRGQFYERISPYWKAGEAQRSRSDFLTKNHQSDTPKLRTNLINWLPELKDVSQEIMDALEFTTSPEAWHRLRVEQKLSAKRAADAMRIAALGVLKGHLPD
jgi:AcrR family transcriptional regulator